MRRPVSLRSRLTLIVGLAVAGGLIVVGLVVFALFSSGIKTSVDSSLGQRQAALEALAREEQVPKEVEAESGERLLQLYSRTGSLLATSRALGSTPLLSPADVVAASHATTAGDLEIAGEGESRFRAFTIRGRPWTAVIAESLGPSHELRLRLAILLALALPIVLAFAAFLGHRVAGAALTPVERMRSRAAQITDSNLEDRLPVNPTGDEIARLGTTFNGLLDRLAGAFERERRIVSDASHELRTPLAILSTELQVATRPERTREQVDEAVRSALEETRRLSRLAEDLLVLARSDEGNLPLRREPLDVQDVLDDLARRNAGAVAGQGRRLKPRVGIDGGAVVIADPDRVAQVLDNLVANSLRYGDGDIEVVAGDAGDRVAFVVTDRGPGFGATLPHAFQRFAQGGPGHGSGLGLAIVEAIARAHGGEATAQDRPGGGAQVTVTFPAA